MKQRKTERVLLALSFIWILNCCTYQHPPIKLAPEKPPPPVEIRSKTPVEEAIIPVEPKAEIETPEPRFYLHKVRWSEETLSHIAKWYTGTVKNWKAIAETNPGLDVRKIDVGDSISIPEELMITHKPMPHSFVRKSGYKKSAALSSSKKTSIQPEPPKLFGPIESVPSTTQTDSAKLFGPIEIQQPSTESDAAKLFGPIE